MKKTQLVWHRTTIPAVPRDKLVLVTEPNLVTVKSVDHRTKTYDVLAVAFIPSLH